MGVVILLQRGEKCGRWQKAFILQKEKVALLAIQNIFLHGRNGQSSKRTVILL